jgi:FtsH-binding integral membrane protein
MINSKFKRIYNTVFIVLSLGLVLLTTGCTIGGIVDFYTGPYDKRDKFLGLGIILLWLYTMFVLVGILGLYSSMKYFLFEPERNPFKILWNIVKLLASVLLLRWITLDLFAFL